MKLQPAQARTPKPKTDTFVTQCEACGKTIIGHDAINFIPAIGCLGKPELAGKYLQCLGDEHWACSLECLVVVAHACIDEHLLPGLKSAHEGDHTWLRP